MALFKPYKITSDKLEDLTIQEGQIIITTDTKKLYVDTSATERIEVTSEIDLSDYVTTSILTSTIAEEASERQKQDNLLEDLINTKLDTSSADNRYALKDYPELTGNAKITSSGWAGARIIGAHSNGEVADYYQYVIGFDLLHRPYIAKRENDENVSMIYLDTDKIVFNKPLAFTGSSGAEDYNAEASAQTRVNIGAAAINHTHDAATTSSDGFMSAEDKAKLDGLEQIDVSGFVTKEEADADYAAISHTHDDRYFTESEVTDKLATKADTGHQHAASDITSGTFALDRIPTITDAKISSMSASKLTGTIPTANLPSYVDDVVEGATTANFPETGEAGKIYVATSTNKTYRWSGSGYVEISASLSLGTTSSTAFRGDYGNVAYTHATAKGAAFASGLYKITTNAQGHVTAATAVTKADITGLGIPAQDTNTNTTYTLTKSGSTITLTGSDGSKTSVTDANTTYSLSSFGITATAAELNKLDGCTATVTELNYVDGVTSNIQTQLNNKAATSHNHSAANITSGTLAVARGGTGTTALTGSSGLIHNMFDTSGVTSYIASFTSNWADGGYCTPQQLRSAQGLGNTLGALPVANGGTGSTTASAARVALGITPANIGALPLAGGTMNVNAQIARTGSSTSWVAGRSVALLKTTTSGSPFYGPLWSCKTYQGSWDCGTYTSDTLHFSYITDTDFSENNNKQTADIVFNTNGSITAKTFVGALSGNASTATTATQANYWTTARTLTFTGNVTGSVSVRGNANMSCSLAIANGAVTTARIADNAVTAAKIAAKAVTASEIASGAVGLSELSSAVGTVAVQSATPTDSHVKLWIKV